MNGERWRGERVRRCLNAIFTFQRATRRPRRGRPGPRQRTSRAPSLYRIISSHSITIRGNCRRAYFRVKPGAQWRGRQQTEAPPHPLTLSPRLSRWLRPRPPSSRRGFSPPKHAGCSTDAAAMINTAEKAGCETPCESDPAAHCFGSSVQYPIPRLAVCRCRANTSLTASPPFR